MTAQCKKNDPQSKPRGLQKGSTCALARSRPQRTSTTGKLALKGTARDLVVPVSTVQSGRQSTATGEFVLKRLDFKIGENEWADLSLVANDVRIRFKLVFTGFGGL
jgi:polyisoprenoid-binding protein YceI